MKIIDKYNQTSKFCLNPKLGRNEVDIAGYVFRCIVAIVLFIYLISKINKISDEAHKGVICLRILLVLVVCMVFSLVLVIIATSYIHYNITIT